MTPSSGIAWFVLSVFVYVLGIQPAAAQATVADAFDLKAMQYMRIVNGRLHVTDIYIIRNIKTSDNVQIALQIWQEKIIDNTQTCGTLGDRIVRIGVNQSNNIDIPAIRFPELVATINYYAKFRDSWERIPVGKRKFLIYEIGEGDNIDKFTMGGDKDNVGLELSHRTKQVFTTQDLKIIGAFSDGINEVQKFITNHQFEECL